MEVRADISASPAANLAGELRLDVGQPNVIRHLSPLIAVQWLHR
jgi:hypothetical protein